MKKLMIALCLTCTVFANAYYIQDPIDKAFAHLWYGSKDEQVLGTLARIYLSYKADRIDDTDFYMDILEAIIHDEPLPD
jgi:hypothetical protein